MNCPFCSAANTQVENSRETNDGERIWRRRKCTVCGKVFSTYEGVGLDYLVIEKRNGKHTRYQRHKLFASIYDAIVGGKRKDRGDAANEANVVVAVIERRILANGKRRVTTQEIIDLVTGELEGSNLGACYRYAAFSPYRGMRFGTY